MSALSCAQVRDLAPELSFGILSGAERAEVVLHVNGCARCQAYVSELTDVADAIPQLVPEVEPPAGFESRVLRRLGEDQRRSRRRWVATMAAAAAAAVIISITVVRVVESNDTSASATPVAVFMQGGAANRPAGWAYVSGAHGVAVSVSYGVPGGRYQVRVQPTRGASGSIGTMVIDSGHGSWTGSSTFPLGAGSRIALVDATGHEACHGVVPRAE
jgi:hypothetical protein